MSASQPNTHNTIHTNLRFGVHLDDRLKLWWTDTKHGGVPELVSDIKGEGRWGKPKPWKQIPTGDKNDAMVDSNLVMDLLLKRDGARRKKDFATADGLLARAVSSPSGGLTLRVHDESRTWRIWTERPPPRKGEIPASYEKLTQERCLEIGKENGWEQNPWKQISTDEENDAMVDTNLVTDLLMQRDAARDKKDFFTADALLAQAVSSPSNGRTLRIHDESRTWRIWTERPPPRKGETPAGYEGLTPEEMCLQIVKENEPEKVDEIEQLLRKFPGREWNVMKRLKERYTSSN